MIIHPIQITRENGEICVSTRIETRSSHLSIPKELWFKFPESYENYISNPSDGAAVSLILLSMALGETMEVRESLSSRLVHGLNEYQRIMNLWFPNKLKVIDITCSEYKTRNGNDTGASVGCAFSGGVDSFYTLWTHLSQNERNPNYQISHALFIHGYDLYLKENSTYKACLKSYRQLMEDIGLKLLTARTNIKEFFESLDWSAVVHGPALIGSALILSRLFSRFFIPSTYTYDDLFPWGSHPLTDPLLSTETMQVIHDGASINRVEKTAVVSQWSESYSRLRVCWEKPNGLLNCCRCGKCIRTMTTLNILGVLHHYKTFPLPLKSRHIQTWRFSEADLHHVGWILQRAKLSKRKDIIFNIYCSMFLKKIIKILRPIALKIPYVRKRFTKKRENLLLHDKQ